MMEIVADNELTPGVYSGSTVAIGNFDGVHLGHRALVGALTGGAKNRGGPSVVYTFDPHPLKVLNPSASPAMLTDFAQKAELLDSLGVDVLVRARFDHEYASMEPAWFAEDVLFRVLGASEVWIGPDFAFGRNRTGNVETLKVAGARLGYEVRSLDPLMVRGGRVSSTRIRKAVTGRDFALASELLGRPFALHGPVVKGMARGRKLGFPTANILNREECVPPHGVYACRAILGDGAGWVPAAVNIGSNPTFGAAKATVEAHLLDFSGDIYGQNVKIEFVKAIRGEIAFASVEKLVEQIARDVLDTSKILGRGGR